MLPIGDNIIAARARFRGAKQSDWRNLFDARTNRDQTLYHRPAPATSNNGRLFTSKFAMSIAITVVILIAQILIVHHYIGSNSGKIFKSKQSDLQEYADNHAWLCYSSPYLADIIRLAKRFHLDLVIVDPDLLELLDETGNDASVAFSGSNLSDSRGDKTIIHLAAINATSGGQPNLKMFYNALKHHNYSLLKYDDNNQAIAPEVYRGPPNMFDDMLADAINDKHAILNDILSTLERKQDNNEGSALVQDEEDVEISKIYTEFMTHLFLLNDTSQRFAKETASECKQAHHGAKTSPFVVISILVMYNFEYKPDSHWLQPSLYLDEVDKHKLLSHRVHSKDFRLPLENYYIHEKRQIVALQNSAKSRIQRQLEGYKVFEPSRLLSYVNNTYVQCKESSFNISGLIDNTRQMSNYLRLLDTARPLDAPSIFRNNILGQVLVALQFMDVFSSSYGNFSFWLTGSSLLAYHKFCELAMVPSADQSRHGSWPPEAAGNGNEESVVINLELGMFAMELNSSMLSDLEEAKSIGVTMMSDWRRPNAMVSFHVRDCPNLIFNLYPYELKRDFYEYYYATRHSMIMSHKFKTSTKSRQERKQEKRNPYTGGQHIFTTRNLQLCWTRVSGFHPFRVPCDVHDHLRRIFVI